jgi:hypothetical protein
MIAVKEARGPPFSPRRDATKPPSYRDLRVAASKDPRAFRIGSFAQALWLYVDDPALRDLIGSFRGFLHIGQGFELRVVRERVQQFERVLASAVVSSSKKQVALGRRKMSVLHMMQNIRGRRSAGLSGHGSISVSA